MPDSPAPAPVATLRPPGKGWIPIAVGVLIGFEGLITVAWHDKIDPPGVNTVCYGHIEDVQIGDKYTKIQCSAMLAQDLPRYEAMVQKCIHVPMPDYRHAAIISFTYNVGGGALCKSSVARKLNAGDVQGGCDALLLYDRANGKVIKGLQTRRIAERKMCLMTKNADLVAPAPPVVIPTIVVQAPPEPHIDISQPNKKVVVPPTAPVVVQRTLWELIKAVFTGD